MINILYAGSPEPAATTLQILFDNAQNSDSGYKIVGVLSNPPTAKGRHKEPTPTPVAALAQTLGLPVLTPEHLDSAARDQVKALNPDILVCFAYGHIFGPKFLECFKYGGINLHPSLLPKYRGCTPVPAAIINGDKQTAATIQTLSLKMDEGDILAQKIIDLNGSETTGSLLDTSAKEGEKLICDLLNTASQTGKMPQGKPQSGEASYTSIITKEDAKINWSESAQKISAKIRAYNPEPCSWCIDENNQPLKILEADFVEQNQTVFAKAEPGKVIEYIKPQGIMIQTGDGILVAKKLQRQGKNAMLYKDFMNGARNFTGTILK